MKYIVSILLGFSTFAMYGQNPFFLQKGTECEVLYSEYVNDVWLFTPDICEDLPFDVKLFNVDTFWQDSIDKRHLKIIPRGSKTKIEMHYYDTDGKKVFLEKVLLVVSPPNLMFHFEVDGKWEGPIRIDKNSNITFSILNDPDFTRLMGSQIDYRVDSIEIYILPPNNSPPEYIKTIGFDINQPQSILSILLPPKCFAYGSGTIIYAEVGTVYRRNEKGELLAFFVRNNRYDKTGTFYVK